MISIDFKSRYYNIYIELNHKFNVLKGYSGRGKTGLVDILQSDKEFYNVTINDKRFSFVALTDANFEVTVLAHQHTTLNRIYITDDQRLVNSLEFARFFSKNKDSIFIVCEREVRKKYYKSIPYSADAIYEIVSHGKEHKIKNFIKPKDICDVSKIDRCITENSGTGKKFFSAIFKECLATKSRDKIRKYMEDNKDKLSGDNYLAIDWCGAGSVIEEILESASYLGINLYTNENYQSFEYLLLKSNMFQYYPIDDNDIIINNYDMEAYYTAEIERLTKGTLYSYSKYSELKNCYIKECCSINRKDKCDKGLSGDKITALLKDTEFAYLLKYYDNYKKDFVKKR